MSRFSWYRRGFLRLLVSSAPLALVDPSLLAAGSVSTKRKPSPVTASQIHSGHSLTDAAVGMGAGWPNKHYGQLLNSLSQGKPDVMISTVPGSSMLYRKENAPSGGWNDMSRYDVISTTERNDAYPLAIFGKNIGWINDMRTERRQSMLDWFGRSQSINRRDFFYYTPWPAHSDYAEPAVAMVNTPTSWRNRLGYDEAEHLDIVDYAEAKVAGRARIWVIPGNAMMMRIYDDAEAGKVPGLANGAAFMASSDWWSDNVHPQGLGSLALAYLHMYVIHHIDPRGKPYSGFDLSPEPNAAQAVYIQNMIYDLVQRYPRSGVR